jgi:hypothetical protein
MRYMKKGVMVRFAEKEKNEMTSFLIYKSQGINSRPLDQIVKSFMIKS